MSMRKVALFMMVSLDGFFEGVDHEFDWHNVDEEFEDFAAKQLGDADVLLFGRKTYQMMADYWTTAIAKDRDPVIAGFMNSMPKLVFSRTLRAAEWQNTQIVKNHVVEEIRKLTQQPGKDLLVLGSNNLSVSLLEMGLLDEIRVMLAPLLIGRGNSLFCWPIIEIQTASRGLKGISVGERIADLPKAGKTIREWNPGPAQAAAKCPATNRPRRESLFT